MYIQEIGKKKKDVPNRNMAAYIFYILTDLLGLMGTCNIQK